MDRVTIKQSKGSLKHCSLSCFFSIQCNVVYLLKVLNIDSIHCCKKIILFPRVHPWMIKLNMNWTLRVMGKEVALRSSDQEAAPYLRTVFRKRTCTRNATIKDRMWHQYVQVYKKPWMTTSIKAELGNSESKQYFKNLIIILCIKIHFVCILTALLYSFVLMYLLILGSCTRLSSALRK